LLLILLGLLIVSVPIAIAMRTTIRLTRTLGGADAGAVADAIAARPDADLPKLADALAREAPGSIAERLVRTVVTAEASEPTPLLRKLALAEAVADVEREMADDARTPRVAASLATTGGLLAATLAMREGLGRPIVDAAGSAVPYFQDVVERGLTMAGIAVFGGIVCAALHRVSIQLRRRRLDELDALMLPLAARYPGVVEV
jgi:hypothetical protein